MGGPGGVRVVLTAALVVLLSLTILRSADAGDITAGGPGCVLSLPRCVFRGKKKTVVSS